VLIQSRFHCVADTGKQTKIRLEISISDKLARGIKTEDLIKLFKDVGKRSNDKKVIVTISRLD